MGEKLVSIITPVHNAEKFILETIKTVQCQTYKNWELILVDDCSTDNTKKIAMPEIKKDSRIIWVDLEKKSGSAAARNKALSLSRGEYVCYLDVDDLWEKTKLEKQILFMQKNGYAFSYTSYEFANENGQPNGKKVIVPKKINYEQALKNLIIWTSTVMFDMSQVSKNDLEMPNVKRGQDMATWWQVLKVVGYAYGMREVLAYYRRYSGSLSANKFKALRRTWILYRKIEHLNIFKSVSCFVVYCFNAIKKRV